MKVAVVKEVAPGERRVALVPETVPRLTAAGLEVLVEQGAGDAAWFPDSAYLDGRGDHREDGRPLRRRRTSSSP